MKFKKGDIVLIKNDAPTYIYRGKYKIEKIFYSQNNTRQHAVLDRPLSDLYPENEKITNTSYLKHDIVELRKRKIKKIKRKIKYDRFLNKLSLSLYNIKNNIIKNERSN